jgi:hypothetical protein
MDLRACKSQNNVCHGMNGVVDAATIDLPSEFVSVSASKIEIPGNPRRRDMYECQHKDVLRTSTYPIDAICVPACYLWYIN